MAERAVAQYYEAVIAGGANPKSAANWIIGSLFSLVNRDGVERENVAQKVTPEKMAMLVKLVDDGTINKATGVTVLTEMWETGGDPQQIVDAKGLAQISDTGAIDAAIAGVLSANDNLVQDYIGGKDKVFGPLMGKVMAELKGQGNPALVKQALAAALDARRG